MKATAVFTQPVKPHVVLTLPQPLARRLMETIGCFSRLSLKEHLTGEYSPDQLDDVLNIYDPLNELLNPE